MENMIVIPKSITINRFNKEIKNKFEIKTATIVCNAIHLKFDTNREMQFHEPWNLELISFFRYSHFCQKLNNFKKNRNQDCFKLNRLKPRFGLGLWDRIWTEPRASNLNRTHFLTGYCMKTRFWRFRFTEPVRWIQTKNLPILVLEKNTGNHC